MKKSIVSFCLLLIFLFSGTDSISAKQNSQSSLEDAYAILGKMSIELKQGNQQGIKKSSGEFALFAKELPANEKYISEIKEIKNQAQKLQKQANAERMDVKQLQLTLANSARAIRAYDEVLHPIDKSKERAKLKVLLPITEKLDKAIKAKDIVNAKSAYNELNQSWTANETVVRNQSVATYGLIETNLAFMRIGFEKDPVDLGQIETGSDGFTEAVEDFITGKEQTSKKTSYELTDVVNLLEKSRTAVKDKQTDQAVEPLQEIIQIWPTVEGEVRIKDAKLYNDVENKIPSAIGKLESKNPDYEQADKIINDLRNRLKILTTSTSYTFVDAMLILLREGIEAILIVAGLAAFLKRANKGEGQKWVWSGAFAGIVASLLLAVVMVVFFANTGGAQNRELIEGIIGLAAVIMMLSIGAWLHKRSNILNWNAYFEKNMGKAIATGSLFSMASLSFLAIFREGAETVIFYIGMAPAIEMSQLVLGIGLALVILIVLGFAMIRYSSRIPLRPFFAAAAWLIYILAFKMIGASIHALQVAHIMPVHVFDIVPFVQWLGIYPTLETLLPQILLIVLILLTSLYIKHNAKAAKA